MNTVSCPVENKPWFIYQGDCIEIMRGWNNEYGALFRPSLIFADPPFNIGHGYDIHDDTMTESQYAQFYFDWMVAAKGLMPDGGLLVINTPDDNVYRTLHFAEHLNLTRIDWVIWHYRFGQCGKTKFISSHCHCLVFRNGDCQHTFNADAILVESDRHSRYGDKRTLESETPTLRVPLDVWDIPRVVGNSKERMPNHPNQLPEKYLRRIVLAYSNLGEMVFDPFGGTGTTAAVAAAHGRACCTIEKSAAYCEDIKRRLLGVSIL